MKLKVLYMLLVLPIFSWAVSATPTYAQNNYLTLNQIKSVEGAANAVILDGLQKAVAQIEAAEKAGKRTFILVYRCPKMGDVIAAVASGKIGKRSHGVDALRRSAIKGAQFAAVNEDLAQAINAIADNGGIVDMSTMPELKRTIKLEKGVTFTEVAEGAKACIKNVKMRAKLFN